MNTHSEILVSKTSRVCWTIFAGISVITLFFPISMISEILIRLGMSMMSWRTDGAYDNLIPFNLFSDYGVPIMTFIKEMFVVIVKTLAPLYVTVFLFQKKFNAIYWELIEITILLFCSFFVFYFTELIIIIKWVIAVEIFVILGVNHYLYFRLKIRKTN